jgi:hypothetical protein
VVLAVAAASPLASTGGASPSISISSPVPIALGGNGTATPAIGAGTNIQTSGTWPQTVATIPSPSFSGLTLAAPLPVTSGGTGTTTPGIVAGSNITTSGTWPNITINASGALGVGSVTGSGNIASSGGTSPNITISATPSFTSVAATGNITAAGDISTKTYYNITTYGASPAASAATNNTAIAAALAAAAGKGTVIIPAGTFNVSASFTVQSNTAICLIGMLFLMAATNVNVFTTSGSSTSHVWIYGGGTINVNGANQTNVSAGAIAFYYVTDLLIENIFVINSYYFSINTAACTNATIRNVTLNAFYTGTGLWATGLGFSGFAGTPCTNCWIEDCHIYNTHDEAIAFYNGCIDCGARGNYINGAVYGIGILTDTAGDPESNGIIIENNSITGCTFPAITTLINGVSLYHKNIIIRGNHVFANGSNSIFITDASHVLVSGNICHFNQQGIYIDNAHGIGEIVIDGNVIYNEGQGGTTGYGVNFNTAVSYVKITNNLFYDTQSTRTMALGIKGTPGTPYVQTGNLYRNLITTVTGIDAMTAGSFGLSYLGGPVPGGLSAAGFSWNQSGSQGEASITTGFNPGSTSVEFFRWNGTSLAGIATISNGGTYAALSDERVKHSIVDMAEATDVVAALRPRRFTWSESGESDVGLIAQEVESVAPEFVHDIPGADGGETFKGLDYAKLNVLLISAVKELTARISALEASG